MLELTGRTGISIGDDIALRQAFAAADHGDVPAMAARALTALPTDAWWRLAIEPPTFRCNRLGEHSVYGHPELDLDERCSRCYVASGPEPGAQSAGGIA